MKTIKPAFQHLWHDLSPIGKGLFIVSNVLLGCVFLVLAYSAVIEAQTRGYYRRTIEENRKTLETICRNAPDICK